MSKSFKESAPSSDCTSKCQSKEHAKKLISIVSKSTDDVDLVYMAAAGVCQNPGKVSDGTGRTVLHVAASHGKRYVAEWLLRFKEASINTKDHESGYTPLHRSLFFGHLDVAKFLIDYGANTWIQDHDGLIPFDHLLKDRQMQPHLSQPYLHRDLCEAYLWGTNENFNLGLGHEQQRPQPEISEQLRKEGLYCKQLSLQKFHSAFVTTTGLALTCGHGRGGRLGHGSEESQLTPRAVKFPADQFCTSVALGVDHSLFLMSSGVVWTCGSNQFHQLGLTPPPTQLTTPQPISSGSKTKLPAAKGIAAARFHSLLWTKDGLYTWGLNAGQIGHLKSDDKTVSTPKFVTSFTDKKIRDVATSDAAIVILTESGDVFALADYTTRRIVSTKQFDIVKMVVIGGDLDFKVLPSLDLYKGGGDDLKLFFLTKHGRIIIWQDNRQQTQASFSIFNASKELWVSDIAVSKSSSILVITKDGEGYEVSHITKQKSSIAKSTSFADSSKVVQQKSDNILDILKVKSRLVGVSRAVSIYCDPKGKNFGALQVSPSAELSDIPEVEASTIMDDYFTLLKETDEFDPLHDVALIVGGKTFYAHKFLLAASCEKLATLVRKEESPVQLPYPIEPEIFEQVLQYIYTRTCDLMKVGPTRFKLTSHVKQGCDEPLKFSGDPTLISAYTVYSQNGKSTSKSSKKSKKVDKKMDRVPSNEVNPIAALQEAAKSFGLNPLVQSLAGLRYIDGKIEQSSTNKQNFSYDRHRLRFSRKSFPEFHDISIKTQDEVELQAHRCVLAARLDYFRSMFASGCWIEGQKNRTLKIPVQSKFMIPLLDFIYTDEFPSGIKSIDEAEFFCNLIVTADQFLAPRLVQMCERHLSGMLTLKNVGEILQFASDFSAKQLKQTCLQFVSQNLATLLEIKGLESLDVGHLRDLSHYYRRNFRHVDSRRLTPYETGPSIAEIESFYSGAGLTVGDVFAEEEEAAVSAAGQVKARKKSGSTGRSRRLSSESCSSDDDSRNSLKLCESIFDDLEEKSHPVNPVFDPVTPTSCETTENENFLKEFFSSPKQASPLQHSSESKRFHKLSQKERKRLASQSVATSTPKKENNSNDVTKEVETPKWTGWSTQTSVPSGMSTTSLAEIIEKEREQLKTMSITSDKQKLASKKSSWRQISFDDRQSVAESPPKNPWKVLPHQETPKASNGAPKNFHQILNEEVRQSENLVRAVSKPLWVTQIEEKAIEELKIFYNVDKVFDEHVKVSRVDDNRKMATPLWRKSLTKK